MPTIRIYEPALCCDTGVCGVDVDQSLVTVTADVRRLQELGADIVRHDLATDPTAFTGDETVRAFMNTVGSKGLPLTVVDGVTVATGSYPTGEALRDFAGLGAPDQPSRSRLELGLTESSAGGCCGGSGCC
ncbi:arsenite efflux transporter metallochaperone ArsD [Lacisediminihabitans sp. H27-G8]|uniref:arsenite efflux transporter metallochaperone ArsD n=1 Tax=Lacisediminihabitans sp. H27-G8 TaxID=3111909 RepID=UPI0038FC1CE1